MKLHTIGVLFAGGGGDTQGAIEAGYKPLWAVENSPKAAAIYRYRFPEVDLFEKDVTSFTDEEILALPATTGIIGGSPCQDVSTAGQRKGIKGDRSRLFFEYLRFLKLKEPKFFIFENVKGLLSSNQGADFEVVLASFTELGYCLTWELRNSIQYVPQQRERIFITGIKSAAFSTTYTLQDAA